MQVSVTGRHYEVTPALRTYLDARMNRLHRFAENILSVNVTLSGEKHLHRAEVILRTNGREFTGKEVSEDMYSALDRVTDKLEKQLRRHKDRRTSARRTAGKSNRNGASLSGTMRVLRAGSVGHGAEGHDVVQAGDFPIEAMTVDEAILRLEQVEESFVVFSNSSTELIHIVYKTPDGNYGVLNLHATH
ncbi:MAG: ribosome-associated translation inhibitor RaiA [Candidatus Latescibacterota bacterium]|nr:MAG: ribosome-associated translation inhibitor RaiA [Candidatus Latescibacterota bacterium]